MESGEEDLEWIEMSRRNKRKTWSRVRSLLFPCVECSQRSRPASFSHHLLVNISNTIKVSMAHVLDHCDKENTACMWLSRVHIIIKVTIHHVDHCKVIQITTLLRMIWKNVLLSGSNSVQKKITYQLLEPWEYGPMNIETIGEDPPLNYFASTS